MRKALVLSLGVGVTLVVAVFVGAAAATTGAPVFYDARYPAPVSVGPEGYDVTEGGAAGSGTGSAQDEAVAEDMPQPAPEPTPRDATPRATAPAVPPTGAPGTPTPTPTPEPTPTPTPGPDGTASDETAPPLRAAHPSAEERRTWLAFQQIVRECMADVGQEYLYWEWWNHGSGTSNRFPAMPADLTAEAAAGWEFALHGDSGLGDDYRWEDAGCWGYAVHVTGGTH